MKYIMIIIVIIVLIIAGAGYLYYSNTQSQDDMFDDISLFDSYLRNKEYDKAKAAYEDANITLKANYNITLDTYSELYISSINEDMSAEDILNDLYEIETIGYAGEEIKRVIKQYEDLLQSNYAYEAGLELYRENKFEEAIDCLNDVVESDENYETAMQIIADHYNHEKVFEEAETNKIVGRNPLPNAVTKDDGHMYVPYINDNAYCILKISDNSRLTHVLPIIGTDYPSEIDDINIIGDYIYFTLFAKSIAIDNYSGIYRIKTDGSALQKLSDDILSEMISYGDKFFGVSEGELRRYDSRFMDYDVLYEGDIRSMQMTSTGFYLGMALGEEDSADIEHYKWDFENEEIQSVHSKNNKNGLYQVYDEGRLVCYDYRGNMEWLFMIKADRNNQYINIDDIGSVIGTVDANVVYTVVGDYQQECAYVFDIKKEKNIEMATKDSYNNVPVGICYEDSLILSERNHELYLCGIDYDIDKPIIVPASQDEILELNQNTILKYCISENAHTAKPKWSYQADGLDINIDNYYREDIESDIYVIEIVSDDMDILDMAEGNVSAGSDYAFAMSLDIMENIEDSTDTDATITNNIITSDGMIIDKDGQMLLYSVENLVTKDIYTYDNVALYIEQGYAALNDYAVDEIMVSDGNYTAIGTVKKGHYVIITADISDEDNKPLTPYQCGRLLSEMGCSDGYCYANIAMYIYLDGEMVFSDGADIGDDAKYLLIE